MASCFTCFRPWRDSDHLQEERLKAFKEFEDIQAGAGNTPAGADLWAPIDAAAKVIPLKDGKPVCDADVQSKPETASSVDGEKALLQKVAEQAGYTQPVENAVEGADGLNEQAGDADPSNRHNPDSAAQEAAEPESPGRPDAGETGAPAATEAEDAGEGSTADDGAEGAAARQEVGPSGDGEASAGCGTGCQPTDSPRGGDVATDAIEPPGCSSSGGDGAAAVGVATTTTSPRAGGALYCGSCIGAGGIGPEAASGTSPRTAAHAAALRQLDSPSRKNRLFRCAACGGGGVEGLAASVAASACSAGSVASSCYTSSTVAGGCAGADRAGGLPVTPRSPRPFKNASSSGKVFPPAPPVPVDKSRTPAHERTPPAAAPKQPRSPGGSRSGLGGGGGVYVPGTAQKAAAGAGPSPLKSSGSARAAPLSSARSGALQGAGSARRPPPSPGLPSYASAAAVVAGGGGIVYRGGSGRLYGAASMGLVAGRSTPPPPPPGIFTSASTRLALHDALNHRSRGLGGGIGSTRSGFSVTSLNNIDFRPAWRF